jgi:phosphate:Na+ symporter
MFLITLAIDWQWTIFHILGGLGIFLFGINLMGDSLKKIAGKKLKIILEKTTNTPLKGIFVGIIVTGLIQSSSATTVLVVGLVRAGLMTLPQAVGVIFGANIGTTVTSILIGLDIGAYALPIMFLGSALTFFFQKKKVKEIGKTILGFGMLFFGLELMGDSLKQLVQLPSFSNMLLSVGNYPILGVLVGLGTTIIIQSSSATIGLLQQLYATGGVPIIGAVAIVLGDNIGTTITSVIASIGAPSAAKRSAAIHVMFNVIGSVVFFIFIRPYTALVVFISEHVFGVDYLTDKMTVSVAHVLFNLITVFILYWFIKQMVWIVTKLIPSHNEVQIDDIVLDESLVTRSGVLALENTKKAIINMGNVCRAMFEYTYDYSFENNPKNFQMGMQCEEIIDGLDDKIHNYLVRVGAGELGRYEMTEMAKQIDTISDLERIGDHLTNLLEFFEERYTEKIDLHPEAKTDLVDLYTLLRKTLHQSLQAFETKDIDTATEVNVRENELDKLVKKYRKNHINRINDKTCSETEAGYYVDILSNMERIGDHCNNIVVNVLSESYTHDDNFF